MDNKTINPASHLANIIKSAEAFTKQIEKGEGLNIPPEKLKEFKTEMKKANVKKYMDEVKNKMEELKNLAKQMNGKSN